LAADSNAEANSAFPVAPTNESVQVVNQGPEELRKTVEIYATDFPDVDREIFELSMADRARSSKTNELTLPINRTVNASRPRCVLDVGSSQLHNENGG
jgi:hypothetical protein